MEINIDKITCNAGGYGSRWTYVTIDLKENTIKAEKSSYIMDDIVVSKTAPIKSYKYINKILGIVGNWEGDYVQPGLMDGPEVVITIFGEEEKEHYINSVSSKYYPKGYRKVIKYINKLIAFSEIEF